MGDQIYYKVQYPLKKAVDLMREIDDYDLNFLRERLDNKDLQKIDDFVKRWDDSSKEKLRSLITELRSHK